MEYTTVNTTGVSTGVIRTEEKKKEAKTDDMKTWWSQDADNVGSEFNSMLPTPELSMGFESAFGETYTSNTFDDSYDSDLHNTVKNLIRNTKDQYILLTCKEILDALLEFGTTEYTIPLNAYSIVMRYLCSDPKDKIYVKTISCSEETVKCVFSLYV